MTRFPWDSLTAYDNHNTIIYNIIAADSIISPEKHLSRSISLSVSLPSNYFLFLDRIFLFLGILVQENGTCNSLQEHSRLFVTLSYQATGELTQGRIVSNDNILLCYFIRILHWKLFRCCGWTSSWTLLHPWLWPQNLRLNHCSWENHTVAISHSSPAPWPRTSWATASTSLSSFSVCCSLVCLSHGGCLHFILWSDYSWRHDFYKWFLKSGGD